MHYEVELRELLYEDDGAGGLRVTGSYWRPMRVFKPHMSLAPLQFDALGAARTYVGGVSPEGMRRKCAKGYNTDKVYETPSVKQPGHDRVTRVISCRPSTEI